MKTVLFTGEVLNSQAFRELLGKEAEKHLLHIPLERTRYHTFEEEEKLIAGSLNEYTFTIYGGLKNAHYFLKYVEQQHLEKQVLNQIHLVTDHPTRRFLEENGIPAILPRERVKGIDILEFLLRISTQGNVLDRKSTRLNSSHVAISYAVFCLKKKTTDPGTRGSCGPSSKSELEPLCAAAAMLDTNPAAVASSSRVRR